MSAKGFFVVFIFCMNQMLLYTSSTHTSIQLAELKTTIQELRVMSFTEQTPAPA